MTVTGKTSEWPQSCSAAWGGLQRCACAWFMQRWNKCIQEILPVLSCVPSFLSYAALFLKKKKLILQELAMLAFKIYIPCN